MTVQLSLLVNGVSIRTDYFVEAFIDHTVSGMMESLEGTGPISELDLVLDGDKVAIKLNGTDVPINEFVNKIIRSTTAGMLSPLKGVTDIKKVSLNLKK
jgi:hypothetical protein